MNYMYLKMVYFEKLQNQCQSYLLYKYICFMREYRGGGGIVDIVLKRCHILPDLGEVFLDLLCLDLKS